MYRGWNAVLQAVDNGDTQILKLLASKGSQDLSAQDENGRTVLEIMDERGLKEEERILLGGRSPSPQIREANSRLRDFVWTESVYTGPQVQLNVSQSTLYTRSPHPFRVVSS